MLTPAPHVTVAVASSSTAVDTPSDRRSTRPPAFWAASPYARPRPRAITPRGGCSLTAAAASVAVTDIRSADVGLVPPHPVRSDRWSVVAGTIIEG